MAMTKIKWLILAVALLAGQCFGADFTGAHPSCPRVINRVGNLTVPCTGVLVWKSNTVDLAQVALGDSIWRECWDRRTRNVNGGKTTFAFRPVLDSPAITETDRILVRELGLSVGFEEKLKAFVHELVVMDDAKRLHLLK